MKTLGLIAGMVLTTLVAFASTTPSTTPVAGDAKKTIQNYFNFPQILLPNYKEAVTAHPNKVEVLFTTGKDGKVNFVMAKTNDQELKQEIEKRFSHLQLGQLRQNVVHSVVLNFRTL